MGDSFETFKLGDNGEGVGVTFEVVGNGDCAAVGVTFETVGSGDAVVAGVSVSDGVDKFVPGAHADKRTARAAARTQTNIETRF